MTPNLNHGPFTIHELVDTIRGHWQIAGVDVGDLERKIEQANDQESNEAPTILKRTERHIQWMIDACSKRTLLGNCSPHFHAALDEFQMAAVVLADAWSSIGGDELDCKRTVRHLGLAVDRVVYAFDELQRLSEVKKPADVIDRAEVQNKVDLTQTESIVKGVSAFDLGLAIEHDKDAARSWARRFSSDATLTPLGKCPIEGRATLYDLAEMLAETEKLYGLEKGKRARIIRELTTKERHPRTVVSP